jgi:hypothetical protein
MYSKNKKILLKSFFTLIIAIVTVCSTSKASASSYTTLQSGAWNTASTWSPKVTSIGTVGTGDGQFEYTYGPSDVAVDSSGNIYAPATNPARIQKFDSDGNFILKWGSTGTGDGQFNAPTGITIDIDGNIWIYDYGNYRISKFSPTGSFLLAAGWGVSTGANSFEVCTSSCQIGISGYGNGQFKNFNSGRSIVASLDGYVYTGDGDGNVESWVQKFDLNGNFISKWSIGGSNDGVIRDMATDSGNNIYAMQSASISKYNASGTLLLRIGWGVLDESNEFQTCTSSCYGGVGGTGEGQFSSSSGGISVDSNGDIYTDANQPTYFIQKFDSNGNYLFRIPVLFRDGYGSAMDSQDRLYVAAAEPNPQSPDLIYRYDFSQTPSVIDTVTITTSKTVTIPANTTVYAKRIVIDSGGTLTLGTNSNVIYYNSFVNNGTLNRDSETQIKQALIPVLSGSSPITDHTPTFDMVCKTGATVSLLERSNTLASGTCVNNTISFTSSRLTDGSYSFYARETDGDGTRTGPQQGTSNIIDDTVGGYLLGGMGLALGSDGFARIAYGSYRDDNPILYARCTDADCTNPIITEVVNDTGGDGRVPGSNIMTLGPDGFARIVSSNADGFLQMVRCLDQDCITKSAISIDENSDYDPGYYGTSIHMGLDGFPRIMYENCGNNNYDVHYVRFSDDETIATNTNLTTQSGVAPECSPYDEATMAVGQDGFSRYIYMDGAGDDELKLVRCTDNDCTDPVISIIDPDGSNYPGYTASSIKIGSDGFVRVAYVSYDDILRFILCSNTDCSSPTITELPETDGYTTNGMGFDLNSQNLASMTYEDVDGVGHIINCNNQACTDYDDILVDPKPFAFSGSASLVIDSNNIPRITYGDSGDDQSLHYWSPFSIIIYTETPTPTYSTRSGSRGNVSSLNTRPTPVTLPLPTPMIIRCPQGFTCTSLPSSSPAPYIVPKGTFKRDLQKGYTGADVRALQLYLTSKGYPLPNTGYFGPLTFAALQKFQKKNNLPSTGYFGPKTRGVVK